LTKIKAMIKITTTVINDNIYDSRNNSDDDVSKAKIIGDEILKIEAIRRKSTAIAEDIP
jgi:hypothetical protein